jgi:uncharacterized membrane protein YbhN (UPF0104 family)
MKDQKKLKIIQRFEILIAIAVFLVCAFASIILIVLFLADPSKIPLYFVIVMHLFVLFGILWAVFKFDYEINGKIILKRKIWKPFILLAEMRGIPAEKIFEPHPDALKFTRKQIKLRTKISAILIISLLLMFIIWIISIVNIIFA